MSRRTAAALAILTLAAPMAAARAAEAAPGHAGEPRRGAGDSKRQDAAHRANPHAGEDAPPAATATPAPSADPRPQSGPKAPGRHAGGSEKAPQGRSRARSADPARRPAPRRVRRRPSRAGTPPAPGAQSPGAAKTTICHATGSHTRPYVLISVSDSALDAHRRHHRGRDLIPAPSGGCPAATTVIPEDDDRPRTRRDDARDDLTPTISTVTTEGDSPAPRPLTDTPETGGRPVGSRGIGLRAAPSDGGAGPGSVHREAGVTAPPRGSELPFTGGHLGLVAALGVACVIAGLALRRPARRSAA